MARNKDSFYWPQTPDIHKIQECGILCKIPPPIPISSRYFTIKNHGKIDELASQFL